MSRFITYAEVLAAKVPKDFGVSKTAGSSLTIPGQGSDLAQLITSIVKLPPLDERTFDVPSGVEPDTRALAVKTDVEGLYPADGVALAEEAKVRQNERKAAREAQENENEEPAHEAEAV